MASLWQRCFRKTTAAPSVAVKKYFVDVLLKNPWFDPLFAPLVLERQGEIVGFIGRMARPMLFHDRPIRTIVTTQLMTDPDRKLGFAAMDLVRAAVSGPHDLCISDGANEQASRIWQRCGGQPLRMLSFTWTRCLRPMQTFMLNLGEHRRLRPVVGMLHPLSGLVDAIDVRLLPRLYHKPRPHLERCAATPEQILRVMQQAHAGVALRPDYDIAGFTWLLQQCAQAHRFGPLRSVVVVDEQQAPVGWFIYYARPGGAAQVLQIGALYRRGLEVVSELFRDAWEQDAACVSGQLDPMFVTELSNSHCTFRCTELGVVTQSGNKDLLLAMHRGDMVVGRLEGEWWLKLGVDRNIDW